MSRPALAAAFLVSFVLAIGELPSANFVALPGHDPLARFVWGLLHAGVESHLAGIGLILVAGASVLGVGAAWAVGRAMRIS